MYQSDSRELFIIIIFEQQFKQQNINLNLQMEIDEKPVGGGGGGGAAAAMDEFANPASTSAAVDHSGPLEQRIVSKNWQIRAKAYEEITEKFKSAANGSEEVFRDHSSNWKKYLADNNPGSLEKGLDALQAFLDRGDPKLIAASQVEILKALIEKCIGHVKPGIKAKALEDFLLMFEVSETFDEPTNEALLEMINSKQQKIQQTALTTLIAWISAFGPKKIALKAYLPVVENLSKSTVPATKNEIMNFYRELYKWLGEGPTIQAIIKVLTSKQVEDLEKDFKEIKEKNEPKVGRKTRSEQKKAKEQQLDEIIKKQAEEEKQEDPGLDLFEPVDVVAKFGSDWVEDLEKPKKWEEKKKALESLLECATSAPKIKPGDFTGIVKILKKLMTDSMVAVSGAAIKVIAALAKGLKKDFGEPLVRELIGTLLLRFKEKKTQIIDDTREALTNFMLCVDIEKVKEDLIGIGLTDKAPTVKRNTCAFLEKAVQQTYIDVLQRVSGEYLQALIKLSEDSDGDVRSAALQCLGIFKGRLGEAAMSNLLKDMNPQKLAKVNESAKNVQPSKYDRPEKQQQIQEKKPAPPAGKAPAKKPMLKSQVAAAKKEEEQKLQEQTDAAASAIPQQFEETPVGGNKNGEVLNFDDQPIGGGKKNVFGGGSELDEQPIGGMTGKGGGYNLDALGDEAFGGPPPGSSKPKAKPPARFAQKMAAASNEETKQEKTPQVDEVMKDESEAIVVEKKPPPLKKEAPKKPDLSSAGAASKSTKTATTASGPKAPVIADEDLGGGMSKEEVEAKITQNFPPEVVELFEDSKKWNEKVEGYKGLATSLQSSQPPSDLIEAVVRFTKTKMKDWKESNVNIVKEAIALFTAIAQNCEKLSKRSVFVMMPFLSDKLGDVKVVNPVSELLLSLSEVVTPKYVALQLIKYASTAKAPNVIKESCNTLVKMTEDFGIMTMPLKEMIDYAIIAVNNSNPQCRTASMALFATMYKHAGEAIKNFLKDIKESTMKLIDEEFAKVTPFKKGEFQRKRNFKGEAAFEEAAASGGGGKKGAAAGGGGLDDLLPRADISKQLGPKLLPLFKDNDWKKRKEAADKVEEILKGANMRIQPVGLNELMDNIKQRMTDPNKAVLKAYVQLICIVVEALGNNAKQFAKKIMPPMLQNLADKQSLVRADVVTAMDKWAEHCGAELVITLGAPTVSLDNPELRTEMLGWVIKNKDSIKLVGADGIKEMIKPLVECLSDKTPAIRNAAEEVICAVMPLAGYPQFQAVIANLKPAVQQSIKPILEKVKNKCGAAAPPAPTQTSAPQPIQEQTAAPPQIKGSFAAAAEAKAATQGPTLKPQAAALASGSKPQIKPKENLAAGPSQAGENKLNQSIGLNSSQMSKKEVTLNQTPSNAKPTGGLQKSIQQPAGPRLKNPLAASVSNFKAQVQQADVEMSQPQENSLLHVNYGFKEKRAEYDRKNRFPVEEVKQEAVDKLKVFTAQSLGLPFTQKMFSNDFKLHCECIDAFSGLISGNEAGSIVEILDIIFKWAQIRLSDSSNTKFAVNIFDFLAALFQFLQEQQYCLCEHEAAVIVPLLCEKTGLNNAILKDKVKKLLAMVFELFDRQKCYNLIVSHGLTSKNLVAQAECLDEIAEFIIKFGIDYSSEKEMRLVAKMADHASKAIRENALKLLGEAYKHLDDNIWGVIGDVTPKVQGLLEQRFKKMKVGLNPLAQSMQTLQPSASMSNFRPATAHNENLSSSIGYRSNAGGLPQAQPKPKASMMVTHATEPLIARPQTSQQMATARPAGSAALNKSGIQGHNSLQKSQIIQKSPGQQQQSRFNQSNSSIGGGMNQQQHMGQISSGSKPMAMTQRPGTAVLPSVNNSRVIAPQSLMMDDEDEDLRMFANEVGAFGNPAMDRLYEDITRHIHQLKYADLSKRVDSLVSLNEVIGQMNEETQPVLQRAINDLMVAYTQVMVDVFEKATEEINLRFAKYFISIVLKTCSCRELMSSVSRERVFELAEQLLTRLLIDGLDRAGENKEGETVLKNLNSSMLRMLENCNHTYIICALIDLLCKYKDYPSMPKLPNLIVKCLLKLSKIIEKLIDRLQVEDILLSMHEYLLSINHESKTANDDTGIKMLKTVLNEIVKIKRDSIWDAYTAVKCHSRPDTHIHKWIDIILKSLRSVQSQGSDLSSSSGPQNTAVKQVVKQLGSMTFGGPQTLEQEIRSIIEDLKSPEKFDAALQRLVKVLQEHPEVNLDDYLQQCSPTFQRFLKNNLETLRATGQEDGRPNRQPQEMGGSMGDSVKSTTHSDTTPPMMTGSYQYQTQHMQYNHQQQFDQQEEMRRSQAGMNQSLPQQLQRPSMGAGSESSQSDRLSKLQGMKQRMSIMKSGGATTNNAPGDATAPAGTNGAMNTSFSAMNSSLSQRWMSKKSQITNNRATEVGTHQMSNTMGAGFGGGGLTPIGLKQQANPPQSNQPMNQSLGAQADSNPPTQGASTIGGGTAQNSDLNKRLAEMKAKLQALKNQKQA